MTKLKTNNSKNAESKIILAGIVIAIIVLSTMFIYSIVTLREETFSSIGLLDENKTTNNYPDNVTRNVPFYLWVDVGNYQGNVNLYLINITLGNENTTISKTAPSSSSAAFLKNYLIIVENSHTRMQLINLSINVTANKQRLIFELWVYNPAIHNFEYLGLWVQIWINIL